MVVVEEVVVIVLIVLYSTTSSTTTSSTWYYMRTYRTMYVKAVFVSCDRLKAKQFCARTLPGHWRRPLLRSKTTSGFVGGAIVRWVTKKARSVDALVMHVYDIVLLFATFRYRTY